LVIPVSAFLLTFAPISRSSIQTWCSFTPNSVRLRATTRQFSEFVIPHTTASSSNPKAEVGTQNHAASRSVWRLLHLRSRQAGPAYAIRSLLHTFTRARSPRPLSHLTIPPLYLPSLLRMTPIFEPPSFQRDGLSNNRQELATKNPHLKPKFTLSTAFRRGPVYLRAT